MTIDSQAASFAKQFEPILLFHPDEKFFLIDPKFYIERCAQWVCRSPWPLALALVFQRVLDIWIGSNGVVYSTQTAAIFQRLRAHYHNAPKGAFILCRAKAFDIIPDDEPLTSRADTVSTRGWKVMTNVRTRSDDYGPPKFVSGDLAYVDFIPDVLEQDLGQPRGFPTCASRSS